MSTMFRDGLLAGKRILVTGGGTGLGKEMAEDYLRLGATVHICGRRKGVLDDTARELMDRHGGKVITHSVDIRVAQAVDEMIEEIFTALDLNAVRPAWTGSARRAPSDRPPVLAPHEVAKLNGHSSNGHSANGSTPDDGERSDEQDEQTAPPPEPSWEPPTGESPVGR